MEPWDFKSWGLWGERLWGWVDGDPKRCTLPSLRPHPKGLPSPPCCGRHGTVGPLPGQHGRIPSPLLTMEALLGVLRQPHGDSEANAGGATGDEDGAGHEGGHGCTSLRSKVSYEIRTQCHVGAGSTSPGQPWGGHGGPLGHGPLPCPPIQRTAALGHVDGDRRWHAWLRPRSQVPTLGPSRTPQPPKLSWRSVGELGQGG